MENDLQTAIVWLKEDAAVSPRFDLQRPNSEIILIVNDAEQGWPVKSISELDFHGHISKLGQFHMQSCFLSPQKIDRVYSSNTSQALPSSVMAY